MNKQEYTGIRDFKLRDILNGDIVITQQGTKFLVEWSETKNMWCLIQSNKGTNPELQGDWFELKRYMQPNIEVIGNIYDSPELIY